MGTVVDWLDDEIQTLPPPPDRKVERCRTCGRKYITYDGFTECFECREFFGVNCSYMTDADGNDVNYDDLTYPQYLASDHWAAIRKIKIDAADGKCACCNSTLLLQVHHRKYPVERLDITPDMLVVLCKRCHEALHKGGR